MFVSFLLLIGLGAALVAVTLTLQSGHELPAERRSEVAGSPPTGAGAESQPATSPSVRTLPGPDAPPVTAAIPPRASVPSTGAPVATAPRGATVVAPPIVPRPVNSPYRLVVKTTEPTWLRVRTSDRGVSEENIPAGQRREWVSNRPFILTVGNAGGVSLELNGRPLPALGASGAVIRDFVLPREQP